MSDSGCGLRNENKFTKKNPPLAMNSDTTRRVHGFSAIFGEECEVTAGGIALHKSMERVNPSSIDNAVKFEGHLNVVESERNCDLRSSVYKDIRGTVGNESKKAWAAINAIGKTGENRNVGVFPSNSAIQYPSQYLSHKIRIEATYQQ